jgi:purine-nucleoside phosphorylase
MSEAALATLRQHGVTGAIEFGLVLGTGLGQLAEAVEAATTFPYADLPGFPQAGVSGHAGQLVIGRLEGVRVALLQGRAHYYEQGEAAAMAGALETLAKLGVHTLILTNAAGSLHAEWHPGSLALISDHINFSGTNPLIGAADDNRFVTMNNAYDQRLRLRMKRAALAASIGLHEGVYMWFSGPSFETPAEIRMAKSWGADLVGMSTVPETILGRRYGLRIVALSVITNYGAGIAGGQPSHRETKETALSGALGLRRLVRTFLRTKDE